ncbi:hypothetical protein Q3G72_007523 [Acer saccharum]|nr:hypothetical protein Q3G72_007523 [Acer saccharum]
MSCGCFGSLIICRKKDAVPAIQALHGIDRQLLGSINHFSYNELKSATENFQLSNKIGRGGFGTVYKGILKNGTLIAVKTLSAESKQGVREFLTEINTLTNVRHPNLVELIGCCVEGNKRILVYEYVENNSLDHVLLGSNKKDIKLNWEKRSAICIGIAKGDFGLAKLFPDNITHITTRIAGTTGYLAPEYILGGQLTMKADVYSFGVLILEIICGRSSAKANWGDMPKYLLEWAWQLHQEGKLLEIVDPGLEEFLAEEVTRYMKVAFFCTQAAVNRRPPMSQVVEMLSKNIRLNDKELTAPGFFQDSGESSSGAASSNKKSVDSNCNQLTSVPTSITHVTPR